MTTREDLYTALRNADAAGDTESVRKLAEYLQAMPAEGAAPAKPAAPEPARGFRDVRQPATTGKGGGRDFVEGVAAVAEPALSLITGIPAAVVGGVAGIGKAGVELAKGKGVSESLAAGGGTARDVSEAMTYEPRTESGKTVAEAISVPMEVAKRLLGAGGEKAGALVGPKTAAAGRTLGEVAPDLAAAAFGARTALRPTKPAAPVPGRDYTPLRDFTPEQSNRFFRMQEQGVEPTLGAVTRDSPQVRFEQQTALTPAGAILDQRFREQDAALTKSVQKLKEGPSTKGSPAKNEVDTGQSVRTALESRAAAKMQKVNDAYDAARAAGETKQLIDATALFEYFKRTETDAVAVPELKAMKAALEELDAKTQAKNKKEDAPEASVTRDGSLADLEAGRKLVHRGDNATYWKDGEHYFVRGGDVGKKRQLLPEEAKALFDKDDPLGFEVKKTAEEIANEVAKATENDIPPRHISIDDLEKLRQKASNFGLKDGSIKSYMTEIRKGIDEMTDGVGGEHYKAARKERREYGLEFEEQLGNAKVLDKATDTDYKVAVEDVWDKTVRKGSIKELADVIKTLRGTGKLKKNDVGVQALKDLQTRTIDYLTEQATKASKDGREVFSPGAFKQAIDSIGAERLMLLLGRDTLTSLRKTLANAEATKTAPVRAPGSDTRANEATVAQRLAADHADHLIKGVLPAWAARIMGVIKEGSLKRAEARATAAAVNEAMYPRRASNAQIAAEAKPIQAERNSYLMREAAGRTAAQIPATMVEEDE